LRKDGHYDILYKEEIEKEKSKEWNNFEEEAY